MNVKKLLYLLIITLLATSADITFTACSRKSGCPAYDSLKAPVNRKGELSTKGGKSGLFPKNAQKRKRK